MQSSIIKGLSSYLLFRICENLRKRYPKGHFWTEGYFCDGVGKSDYAGTWTYIENQELQYVEGD
jgi:REP element-mobilizing transposase RayT